jgi:hypothetical protein
MVNDSVSRSRHAAANAGTWAAPVDLPALFTQRRPGAENVVHNFVCFVGVRPCRLFKDGHYQLDRSMVPLHGLTRMRNDCGRSRQDSVQLGGEFISASTANGLALDDLPGVEQVELDFPYDVGDAGLAGFPGGEVAGFP